MTLHIATGVGSLDSHDHTADALSTSSEESLHSGLANAEECLAVIRIATEALGTVLQILQRMHTVVGQAGAQDPRSVAEISAAEIATLNSLLEYIAGQTAYRSASVLDGSYQISVRLGGEVIGLDLRAVNVGARALGTSSLEITATRGGRYDPTADLNSLDAAIAMVSAARGSVSAVHRRLEDTMSNLQTAITNVTASRSPLTDADLAGEVTVITRSHLTLLR